MPVTAAHVTTGFIADLHLDATAPEVSAHAERYFLAATECDVLWILGDLFDAWIGDDAPFDQLAPPMQALSALTASGTAVHVMHGNRDFLLGDGFAERTGVVVHSADAIVIDLADGLPVANDTPADASRCLLMHGDTLCTDDTAYLELRTTLRNPAWQQDMLSRSLEERAAIAASMRDGSREAMQDKSMSIMDVANEAVADAMKAHQVHTLVHGHTHRPADHRPACAALSDGSRRVVLGDWGVEGAQVARVDTSGKIQLRHFP